MLFSGCQVKVLHANRTLKFTLMDGRTARRFVVDWSDAPRVEKADYDWYDRYGKINFNTNLTPLAYHGKIISWVPSFNINLWPPVENVCSRGSACLMQTYAGNAVYSTRRADTIKIGIVRLVGRPTYCRIGVNRRFCAR